MNKVFVVMGQTGEYSDRTEWPVMASLAESTAAERVAALDVWLREHKMHMDDDDTQRMIGTWSDREKFKTDLDPHFSSDYTGTKYYVMAVDLV